MNKYELVEVIEVGDAGEIIQTPKTVLFDEVTGSEGPNGVREDE